MDKKHGARLCQIQSDWRHGKRQGLHTTNGNKNYQELHGDIKHKSGRQERENTKVILRRTRLQWTGHVH